jgi:CIC family chloride channel protein
MKILATSLTLGSGGSGGIFAPSLFIGALLGESFGQLAGMVFPGMMIPPGAYALVGMAAVFAGTAHAPISAILLLFEMTGNYKILPPLMVTCVIAAIMVRWMTRYNIYTLKLVRKGIDPDRLRVRDYMEMLTVSDAMIRDAITVRESETIREVGLKIKATNHRGFPVLDDEGRLTGMVTRKDINRALGKGSFGTEVREVMSGDLTIGYPSETLKAGLHKMAEKNIGRLPVVERDDPDHLVGLITRKSLIKAYNQALETYRWKGGGRTT